MHGKSNNETRQKLTTSNKQETGEDLQQEQNKAVPNDYQELHVNFHYIKVNIQWKGILLIKLLIVTIITIITIIIKIIIIIITVLIIYQ